MRKKGESALREQLIAALYASALGRMAWHESLAQLAAYTNTRCITLDYYDLDARAGHVIASNMAPHPAIEEYNQVYGRRNILIEQAYSGLKPACVFAASSLVGVKEFERTDLYNTVYRDLRIKHAAGVLLDIHEEKIVQLSLIKPRDCKDFNDKDLQRLSELAPHMLQAWAGFSHLQSLSASLDALTGLWNHFDHAVMVIDNRLRLHFANRASEALLESGNHWISRNGQLQARDPICHARFKSMVEAVNGESCSVCRLTTNSSSNDQDVLATLIRIDDNRLALVISDPLRSDSDFRPGLRVRFNLTAMEAELINDLLGGSSLREFAEVHGITYETARSHLKNAMSKNGWHRQAEMLVAVLQQLLPLGLFCSERT